nr:DUF350 domain-containing protein [Paenibacillus xylanivorans]
MTESCGSLTCFLTPKMRVCDEIARGNMAVAQLLRSIIIGVSIVIGTFLM